MDPESLLGRARAGDKKAWNDLLAWCRPLVRAQLRRHLPDRPDDASDLTNVAQLRMHKGFPEFRGEALCQFVTWARLITDRVLCGFFRRHRPTLDSLLADPLCRQPEVLDKLIRAEDLVRVGSALKELPDDHRKVIEARLFEGLPPHKIAERLGWPQVRVRVYSKRAVEFLASQLRGKS